MMTTFAGPTAFAQYPGATPGSLAFDASGNLFVGTDDNAPDGADIIVKITPTGTVSTVATGLTRPRGLAFDSSGNLFVAEVPGDTFGDILKFTPGGTGTVGNIVVPNSDWGVAYFDQGSVTGDFTGPNGRINNRGPYNLAFPPNTPASSPGSSPVPVDIGTVGSATDITLTFPSITTAGTTMATPIADPSSVGPLPTGIDATNALAFDITTTATYTTPIIIAVQVLSISDEDTFNKLQVLHWNGTSWDNVTAPNPPGPARDFLTKTIYASASSLSPFVVARETLKAQVQQPINPDGSSVFSVKRGVVPVVFTLTSNGAATCQLPPATISVTRTAGAVLGSIDESTYLSSADKGSNFRISNCQYVYNLATSSLGTGTYKVNISIGGTVVGSGTFALK